MDSYTICVDIMTGGIIVVNLGCLHGTWKSGVTLHRSNNVYIIVLQLLDCCTVFSHTIIKWPFQLTNITIPIPSSPSEAKYLQINEEWSINPNQQCHNIHVYFISIIWNYPNCNNILRKNKTNAIKIWLK